MVFCHTEPTRLAKLEAGAVVLLLLHEPDRLVDAAVATRGYLTLGRCLRRLFNIQEDFLLLLLL